MEFISPSHKPGEQVLVLIDSAPIFTTVKTAMWLEEKKMWSYTLHGIKGQNFTIRDFQSFNTNCGVIQL